MAEGADKAGAAIAVTGRTTVTEIGERTEVEWGLSSAPDIEWIEVFQFASLGERTGPADWVEGGGPDVEGAVVRWFVPADRLADAEQEVARRLEVANLRCGP
jgi:hypothetical protein